MMRVWVCVYIYWSQNTWVDDDNCFWGLSTVASDSLKILEKTKSFNRSSEDDVLSVEPWAINKGEEELWSVGVWSSVGHWKYWSLVLEGETLILWYFLKIWIYLELGSVDWLSSGSVLSGEVTSLSHEVGDDSVEGWSLVAESLFFWNFKFKYLQCRGLWSFRK